MYFAREMKESVKGNAFGGGFRKLDPDRGRFATGYLSPGDCNAGSYKRDDGRDDEWWDMREGLVLTNGEEFLRGMFMDKGSYRRLIAVVHNVLNMDLSGRFQNGHYSRMHKCLVSRWISRRLIKALHWISIRFLLCYRLCHKGRGDFVVKVIGGIMFIFGILSYSIFLMYQMLTCSELYMIS